jgi:nucleotide-binding universal stress UspA family protein
VKILVAYDGSGEARNALNWAAQLAKAEGRHTVTVISVIPTLEVTVPIADAVDPSSDAGKHRAYLTDAKEILAKAGVEASTVLKAGNPTEEILDLADGEGYEVIVVGNRGVGGARRFLMGSVSDRVVRHSNKPVLVVR